MRVRRRAGWGDAQEEVGNSKRKTILPSKDKNFPDGSRPMRWGSRAWASAADTHSGREMDPWRWDPVSALIGETEARKGKGHAQVFPWGGAEGGAGASG